MPIIVNLDVMLAKRKVSSKVLAQHVGITVQNLSILKTGKAKAIKFSTLESICLYLDCQPGDVLEFIPDALHDNSPEDIAISNVKAFKPVSDKSSASQLQQDQDDLSLHAKEFKKVERLQSHSLQAPLTLMMLKTKRAL